MPKKVPVYDLDAAAILTMDAVNANEAVANGPERYTLKKPKVWPPEPRVEPKVEAEAEEKPRRPLVGAAKAAADEKAAREAALAAGDGVAGD